MTQDGHAGCSLYCIMKTRILALALSLALMSACGPKLSLGEKIINNQEPTPEKGVSGAVMNQLLIQDRLVTAPEDLSAGRYELWRIQERLVLGASGSKSKVHANYTHTLATPGQLKDGDKVSVTEPSPLAPPQSYYSSDAPLDLPLEIEVGSDGAISIRRRSFYRASFSHSIDDPSPYWSWRTHATASQGYNLFSLFRNDLRHRADSGKPYFTGALEALTPTYGSFGGYIKRISDELPNVFDLVVLLRSSESALAVDLTFLPKVIEPSETPSPRPSPAPSLRPRGRR
jgi:hypothetical protein